MRNSEYNANQQLATSIRRHRTPAPKRRGVSLLWQAATWIALAVGPAYIYVQITGG